jgi:Uma2 family endonuclease
VTALPEPPSHLLTIAEYAALGETDSGYTELMEGRLVMSPSPVPDHNFASGRMLLQLEPQLPGNLEVIQDIDVDLELAPPNQPGFSRRPDLVVTKRGSRLRVRNEGGMLRASEVVVVIEIVSPGSRRTDYMVKRGEYADAGIPYYWIVGLNGPISLVACHLAGEFGYQDSGAVTDVFATTEPFPARLRLDQLL